MTTNAQRPRQKLIILFSGKRKTNRDFLASALLSQLDESVAEIVRICEPVKKLWTIKMALKDDDLRGPLKEQYRKEMIIWSDKVRAQLPTFFCSEAFRSAEKPITIVSDIRHYTDMDYFINFNIPLLAVRIDASDEKRKKRGWVFTKGIDDTKTECELDDFKEWDYVIDSDTRGNAQNIFENIKCHVKYILKT
ncbi:phosphomevalonate kinase-like [Bradysia coprophila]|uniref:phosphomevalonate kinase-like n=1 Tax=Bradysia coprophila TaxID=38358 RepID=UPI00187DB346|nr:phosphomevalonate kinase-like [Bradysia coprophila]